MIKITAESKGNQTELNIKAASDMFGVGIGPKNLGEADDDDE